MTNNALGTIIQSVSYDHQEQNANMSIQQTTQIDPYEWQQVERGVWRRNCIGHEASATFNENIAYGHTELSMAVSFRMHHPRSSRIAGTELELDEAVARIREGWVRTRYLRPELAVEMDRHADPCVPQTFTYRVLRDEASIRAWVEQTFVVTRLGMPGASSFEEVCAHTCNRPLATQGKQSMLYLVLPRLGDKRDRTARLIWNVSHAVTDGGSIVEFFNVLLQCAIDATPAAPHNSIYTPTAWELDVYPRLPRSVVTAYRTQFEPKPSDVEQAHAAAQSNMRLVSDRICQSLALIPAPSWTDRKHSTICLAKTMEAAEAKELFSFAKQVKSGITYLVSAATIMATAETFPERKATSNGALMGMVRNARRWLSRTPTEGAPEGQLTPLGSDAVFLWIPIDTNTSLEPSLAGLQDFVSVAQKIKTELQAHLTTAHCISSYPAVAEGAITGLVQQWKQIEAADTATPRPSEAQLQDIIGPQAPGFSSVGEFKVHPRFEPSSAEAKASGLWIERTDVSHLGRQVNVSPWLSMLSIDGRIKLQLGFDTKFHEEHKMRQFMERVFGWLRVCAAASSPTTAASNSSWRPDLSASVSARL
ncbi:Acyltransferase invovled in MEL production [Ustilago bromivora]|uniref:Acyltransferase invovled in MEL production n=2 Tax=Ustilago bromivora TaxID=307758 RepID=A0A1K0H714_9BASI|nr:Acyltransferase invovled in MEL production [Ustilago bromivora]